MSVSAAASASKIQMDYMRLLVTQLQNQNPLEPMDNQEMASQLAQFSQLEQLESMNSSFAEVLDTTQRNYATSLIGKEVSFLAELVKFPTAGANAKAKTIITKANIIPYIITCPCLFIELFYIVVYYN